MITVVTAWWGKWCETHAATYVHRLRDGVARHLDTEHKFMLSCRGKPSGLDESVETIPLPDYGLIGEMPRMWFLSREAPLDGRVLLFDLDTVITGTLNEIAEYDGRFAVLDDLWQPGVCGGGVFGFQARDQMLNDLVWEPAVKNPDQTKRLVGGDERFWLRRVIPDADRWQTLYPGRFVSAKPLPDRKLLADVPDHVSVVCFHGNPRPHEVIDVPWVASHWAPSPILKPC